MLIVFSAIIFLFSSIALISSNMALMASDRIFYGVHVNGLPLGGLTKQEAEIKLTQFYQQKLNHDILFSLTFEEQTWEIKPSDIDFDPNIAVTVQKAHNIGREANFIKRVWARMESAYHGLTLDNDIIYDRKKLEIILKKIAVQINRDSSDAYPEIRNNQVMIQPEKNGAHLDTKTFLTTLTQKLSNLTIPEKINLPATKTMPTFTSEHLADIDAVLSSYTTQFNANNDNRSENIRIASNSINGVLLRPNQVFSFNALVGLRIAEAGFKEAPVIIDGKTVPDIGGGVCQVSSTLYSAILLADLSPVERTPHFHPLSYAPIGLDATVADNLIDFTFKNSKNTNVYILSQVNGGSLTIFVLGNAKTMGNVKISLTSTIDKKIPPSQKIEYDDTMPAGKTVLKEAGIPGYIVSSYRIKSIDGKEISRELLYVDDYQSEPDIVVVGRKKVGAAPTPPTSAAPASPNPNPPAAV